jgi:hypothetical protein
MLYPTTFDRQLGDYIFEDVNAMPPSSYFPWMLILIATGSAYWRFLARASFHRRYQQHRAVTMSRTDNLSFLHY